MLTFNNYEKFLRSMTSMFFFITDNRVKEFIFLDNGSYQVELKNFLRQLDKQISKVRVIFSDKNLGIAKGRKVLFDSCQGDYIVSLDSDIVILNPPQCVFTFWVIFFVKIIIYFKLKTFSKFFVPFILKFIPHFLQS